MTLKMKLTASISAFFLVVGLMLMGIFAVNQATVNMGGSINFTATDVYARVTGKIENAQGEYADKELPTIEFSAENGTPDQSEWSGLNLLFDDDATPIVITVKVENLAKDRKLTASLTDNTATNENLVKDLKQDGVTYTSGTTKDLDASTGEGTSTTTYVVTFSIADRNKSLPQMDFDLDIALYDESETPEEPEYEILEGFKFDKNGTLLAYTGSETEVVIPSSYSIIEGEPVDKTLEFSSYEDFEDDVNANMSTYMSMTNFTVILNGHQYGPYDTFEQFAMSEDVATAMVSATSIIFKYQENGDQYVKGNDYQVTAIGYGVFAMNTNITEVTLPSSLTSIGESAFYDCFALEYVDFNYCINLHSIGEMAFDGCNGLSSLDLRSCIDLLSIGKQAFHSCGGLTSIYLPSSLTSIGERAFDYCGALVEVYNYSSHITINKNSTANGYVGYFAKVVYNISDLTWELPASRIQIIDNIKYYIYGNDFIPLTSVSPRYLLSSLTFDSRITAIPKYAFRECINLTSVDLSNCTSLTSIEDYAFGACHSLVNISFPINLTSIGSYAFAYCHGLTSITLPSSLTNIGSHAFSSCYSLAEVYNYSSLIITAGSAGSSSYGRVGEYAKVVYNASDLTGEKPTSKIQTINNIQYYVDEVESEFIALAPSVARDSLTTLTLDSRTTDINQWAFFDCTRLVAIDLNSCANLKSIGSRAFQDCARLTTIDLSNCTSLTSIGSGVFYDCINLARVIFPNTTGWYRTTDDAATDGDSMDMSDPEQNATWLTGTYRNYYFKRNA